jgi:hypothetical protein
LNFSNALQVPVTIKIGGQEIAIPKFTRRDWKALASNLDADRLAVATEGMPAEKQREFKLFYNVPPTVYDEMRRYAQTPDGAEYFVRTSLKKIDGWDDDAKIEQFFDGNDAGDVETLAILLTTSREVKAKTEGGGGTTGGAAADPTTGSAKGSNG